MSVSKTVAQNRVQIQAEARLRVLAQQGDPFAISYLYGYGMYQKDPVGFCRDHLKSEFTEDVTAVINSLLHNKVTIAVSANAVGKSYMAARIAVWFFKTFEDSKVLLAAAPPEDNLKKILWGEIGGVVKNHPHLFTDYTVYQDMNIKRDDESYISGLTIPMAGSSAEREAKFNGKHAPHILFVIDEGDAVPAEVYKGIEACMSGGFARLLIMFNPRADRGYVANMVKRKEGKIIYLSAFNHPNVITGEDKIPGAVTQERTVERINSMTTAVPNEVALNPDGVPKTGYFQVPDFLVGKVGISNAGEAYPALPAGWRKVIKPEFFYKVLGIYPPQSEDQLISRESVDAAISRGRTYVAMYGEVPPMPDMLPVCGMDVADLGTDFNVLAYKYGNYIPPLKVWEGVDTDTAAIKAHEHISKRHPAKEQLAQIVVKVDSTGVGANVVPRLYRLGIKKAARVMVGSKPNDKAMPKEEKIDFYQLRDQLWWMVKMWLENDPGAMLPPDDDLADELCTPIYWKGERDGKIRVSSRETMISLLGRSPDRASSIILLFAPTSNVWTR